jgi:aminoglycoside 2'-N-acetyltransferase I
VTEEVGGVVAELLQYTQERFPAALRWQAVSFMRVQWPFIDGGAIRETYPANLQPVHFALVEGDLLISYAATFRLTVGHADREFQVQCLGNVFTYPASRGAGHGGRVVAAATSYILNGSADVAALLCARDLQRFYGANGWQTVPAPTIIAGHQDDPAGQGCTMMLFVSVAGRAARDHFATRPLQVPFHW